MWLLKMWR